MAGAGPGVEAHMRRRSRSHGRFVSCAVGWLLSGSLSSCGPSVAAGERLRPVRLAPPAFLSKNVGDVKSQKRKRRAPPSSSRWETVMGLRCGGGMDEASAESTEADEGSSQEPLVDVSVVANDVGEAIQPDNDTAQLENDEDEGGIISEGTDLEASESPDEESEEVVEPVSESNIGDGRVFGDSESASDSENISDDSSESVLSAQGDELSDEELAERRSQLLSSASDRRSEGKTLHDAGNLGEAALAFRDAASILDDALEDGVGAGEMHSIVLERATCRLHEALCLLKDGKPGECVEACSDVLGDGVTVVPLDVGDDQSGDNVSDDENEAKTKPTAVVKIVPPTSQSPYGQTVPPQIRARAHHRRAKARLALGDSDGALEDARSAAFMGDRNAVQFYGRLMREGSGAAAADPSIAGGFGSASPFGSLLDGSGGGGSNPLLDGMLQGMGGQKSNPLLPSLGSGSGDFSSSLLSSLLTSGDDSGSGGGNPLGLLGDLMSSPTTDDGKKKRRRRSKKKKGGMDGLAKSLLTSLVKRIEDEDTQKQICNYLHSTNTQQVMQFATMAGVPMKEESAQKLVSLASGVTPKGINKSVSRVKRGISLVKTGRKVLKVIDKYKAFIVLAMLMYWIRAAVTAPYPVSKKQARKLAQEAALSLLILPSPQKQHAKARHLLGRLFLSSDDDTPDEMSGGTSKTAIEEELEWLQHQLTLIEALEERNKAQIDSFVDEQDQWESLEEEERVLLSSKDSLSQRMEELTERLVMLFMGQKIQDG